MPNKDVENAIRVAARSLRGRVTPAEMMGHLQTFLDQLSQDGNNDFASLMQASALCQVLAEFALINGNSLRLS